VHDYLPDFECTSLCDVQPVQRATLEPFHVLEAVTNVSTRNGCVMETVIAVIPATKMQSSAD